MKNAYKRILVVLTVGLFGSSWSQAEEMSFVTVLSSPLGTFANLEAANMGQKSTAGTVNFATGGSGQLNFIGGKFPTGEQAFKIKLVNATLHSDNVTNMKILGSLQLRDGGDIRGKRLIAQTVTLDDEANGRVSVEEDNTTVYNKTAVVTGGKINSLNVGGGASRIGPAFGTEWSNPPRGTLKWSNVFQINPQTGAANSTYKTQFLLTSGKPSGSNEGKGVARVTFDGNQYVVNLMTKKFNLKTVDELKAFYAEHFSALKYVLQPYIISRTHLGNPFDIRIHTRRGAGGKFKVLPYPRIGNEKGVVSNVGSGGYTMRLDVFLKNEFGKDSEIVYNKIMELGNNFPEYYQSFFKTPLFDVGIDVGIQKRGNSYELKIFEVNTYCGGSFVRVEDAITRFEYFYYLNTSII